MQESIITILTELGYTLKDYGAKEWRCQPIYRESNNITSLCVFKNGTGFIDYSAGIKGSLEDLIKLTLNLKSIDEAKDFLLNQHNFDVSSIKREEKPLLNEQKILNSDLIKNLIPDHSYWIGRGISEETLKLFGGGICRGGKMKNRYVLPVYNGQKKLVGLTGRDLTDKSPIKHKHWGNKTEWIFPAYLNLKELQEKREVILVESVGCNLSLWQANIKTSLCLFGTRISAAVISFLIKLDPLKIYVSLNNEPGNNNIGNNASEEIRLKLLNYFDSDRVVVKLPYEKDFNKNFNKVNILKWYEEAKNGESEFYL